MAKQTIQIADKPTLDDAKSLLENSGYGLEAIKKLVDTANTNASSAKSNASNANTNAKSADTILKNSTYGLQALKTLLDLKANETSVDKVESLLKNSGYGLSAIKTLLNTTNTNASNANTYAKSADTILKNSTYGLQAIKSALGSVSSSPIKSIQRGKIGYQDSAKKDTEFNSSPGSYAYYIDITISPCDINKSVALLRSFSQYEYLAVIINSTTLRIYTNAAQVWGGYWQVVEFY